MVNPTNIGMKYFPTKNQKDRYWSKEKKELRSGEREAEKTEFEQDILNCK